MAPRRGARRGAVETDAVDDSPWGDGGSSGGPHLTWRAEHELSSIQGSSTVGMIPTEVFLERQHIGARSAHQSREAAAHTICPTICSGAIRVEKLGRGQRRRGTEPSQPVPVPGVLAAVAARREVLDAVHDAGAGQVAEQFRFVLPHRLAACDVPDHAVGPEIVGTTRDPVDLSAQSAQAGGGPVALEAVVGLAEHQHFRVVGGAWGGRSRRRVGGLGGRGALGGRGMLGGDGSATVASRASAAKTATAAIQGRVGPDRVTSRSVATTSDDLGRLLPSLAAPIGCFGVSRCCPAARPRTAFEVVHTRPWGRCWPTGHRRRGG